MTARLKLDTLPLKVQTYLKAIATAQSLAPRTEWAEGKLWNVLGEEANRYQVDANEVLDSVPHITPLEDPLGDR